MKALKKLMAKHGGPKGLVVDEADAESKKPKMGGLKDEDALKKLLGAGEPTMSSAAEPMLGEEDEGDEDKVMAVLAKLLKIK